LFPCATPDDTRSGRLVMWWWLLPVAVLVYRRFRKPAANEVSDPARNVFMSNLTVVVASIVYVIPLELVIGFPVSNLMFTMVLASTLMGSGSSILANYGAPQLPGGWRKDFKLKLQVLAQWLAMVADKSPDFAYVFLCGVFLPAAPNLLVVVIIFRRAVLSCNAYAAKNLPGNRIYARIKPMYDKHVKPREAQWKQMCNVLEIVLGFQLIVGILLPTRQILTTVLYWHFLKLRLSMQRSYPDAVAAWKTVEAKAGPIPRLIPAFIMDRIKGWMNPPR